MTILEYINHKNQINIKNPNISPWLLLKINLLSMQPHHTLLMLHKIHFHFY
jgi:hypothetical protein